MAHDAEYDCVQGEQHRLLGEGQPGLGLGAGQLRWVCGAAPHAGEPVSALWRGGGPGPTPDLVPEVALPDPAARVPRQRDGAPADGPETTDTANSRSECRTQRPGWAGAHRHGAVRPRTRRHRRERPPHRWC